MEERSARVELALLALLDAFEPDEFGGAWRVHPHYTGWVRDAYEILGPFRREFRRTRVREEAARVRRLLDARRKERDGREIPDFWDEIVG